MVLSDYEAMERTEIGCHKHREALCFALNIGRE